jgi:hypothetical protein
MITERSRRSLGAIAHGCPHLDVAHAVDAGVGGAVVLVVAGGPQEAHRAVAYERYPLLDACTLVTTRVHLARTQLSTVRTSETTCTLATVRIGCLVAHSTILAEVTIAVI